MYEAVNKLDKKIDGHVRWESDSTNLLRWCANPEETKGVRLLRSHIMRGRGGETFVVGGNVLRIRLELLLEGPYPALVKYVDRVERSPHPMLIEQLAATAKRGPTGEGELRLVISCVYPVEPGIEVPKEGGGAT